MLLQWFNANLAKQLIFAVGPKAMEIMSIDGYVTCVPKPLVNGFCRGFAEPAQMHWRKATYITCRNFYCGIYLLRQAAQAGGLGEGKVMEKEREIDSLTEGERHASSLEELLAQFYHHFPQDKQSAFWIDQ